MNAAYGPQRAKGGFTGSLIGGTEGRADKLPLNVPQGSHVIPSDVVSALGDGNSVAGHKVLFGMFPGSKPLPKRRPRQSVRPNIKMAKGGTVPIMASDGEFVVSPEDVVQAGDGDQFVGHKALDDFILFIRNNYINKLKSLPEPEK